jgi:hypothetical protein
LKYKLVKVNKSENAVCNGCIVLHGIEVRKHLSILLLLNHYFIRRGRMKKPYSGPAGSDTY